MKKTLINGETNKVVQESVDASYDHGYYMTIFDISNLSIINEEAKGLEKYHGGKYTIISKSERDDSYCECCNRKLPKKDILNPSPPLHLILTDIYPVDGRRYYTVEFTYDSKYL